MFRQVSFLKVLLVACCFLWESSSDRGYGHGGSVEEHVLQYRRSASTDDALDEVPGTVKAGGLSSELPSSLSIRMERSSSQGQDATKELGK